MMTSLNDPSCLSELSNNLDNILINAVDNTNAQSFAPGVVLGVTNEKETKYLNSKGVVSLDNRKEMTTDAVFCYYSCSKAITTTAILQLVEKGLIDLDVPVKTYLSKIGDIGIIKGWKDEKTPIFEPPTVDITMRMLLTHSAGFSYPFFNEDYKKILEQNGQPNILNVDETTMDCTFLIFEPGTKWHYGMNLDWAGFVLEAVAGQKLGDYIMENIFKPAKMDSCTFHIKNNDIVSTHMRTSEGLMIAPFGPERDPKLDMGGHGIFGTVDDYLKFIRIWLNGGKTEDGLQIIKPETHEIAIQNNLAKGLHVTDLESFQQEVTKSALLDPSIKPDTWSLGFAVNEQDLPTGRPKGTIHWSGVANLYYLIDIKNKVGIFWATQIFPFLDESASGFIKAETAVYDAFKS